MKTSSADRATTTDIASVDAANAGAHTGRASGLAVALGALAAIVGSACGGSSEASQPTDTVKPTTPPSSTIEVTTPTTIDNTTTITVQTTTTDAPTTTEQSTTTEVPTTTVGELREFTTDLSSVNSKVSALFLLLSGHEPITNPDGSVTFDLTQIPDPMRANDAPKELIMRIVATPEVWDTRVIRVTPEDIGWIITNDVSPTLIADTAAQAYALADAAVTDNNRGLFQAWGEYMEAVPGTVQAVEICAQVSNDTSKTEYAKPILVEIATGRIAWEGIYTEPLQDGSLDLAKVSPFSGLNCEGAVPDLAN